MSFIQSVKTPNSDAIKFFPGGVVMSDGVCEFTNVDSAKSSPMAEAIFAIEGVARVFYGSDFVLVTKMSDFDWSAIKPQVVIAILNNYNDNTPLFINGDDADNNPHIVDLGEELAKDDPIGQQAISVLRKYVAPRLAMDGGHIEFRGHKDGIVYVKLRGSCDGCPSSNTTINHAVKSLIIAYIPEIHDVQQVD